MRIKTTAAHRRLASLMLNKSTKPMTFDPLTVAENDYKSDSIAAVSINNYYRDGRSWCVKTKVEVSDERKITITNDDGNRYTTLEIDNTNIESLIEFLQEAQLFISEAELFKKIKGK